MGNKDRTKEWPRTMVLVKVKDFLFRARHRHVIHIVKPGKRIVGDREWKILHKREKIRDEVGIS